MPAADPDIPTDQPCDEERGEAEVKAAFHLRLRARGVRDLAVLRAFELTPRAGFVPDRHAALANRDIQLPLPCGQTSHEPFLSALAVEALDVKPGGRVLEIGSGSGYVTAVLARLGAQVLGLERYARLARAAQERLGKLGLDGAAVVWSDGLAVPADAGHFERILVHGSFEAPPPALAAVLAPGGRLVAGWTAAPDGEALAIWSGGGPPVALGRRRQAPLVPGLSAVL